MTGLTGYRINGFVYSVIYFHMVVNSQKKLVQAEQKEMLTQGGFYSSIVLCLSTTEIA